MTEIASDAPLRLGIDDRLIDGLVAVVVGGVAFFAIVGPQVLDVTNMLWLAQGQDGYTHYLGWEFFRRSPWTWPLGLNPDYGMQFSSSILFSDSIPLLALPLKLFSPWMPRVFQYTGWWLLACFLLQGYFASRIVGLFSRDALVKFGLAVLVVCAPPMLWRLSVHYSLVAHWIVLATIYLYWAPTRPLRWLHWTVLFGLSALIHTYFLGMCMPIWIASLVRRRIVDGRIAAWPLEIAAVPGVAIGALWIAGFFPLRSDMLSWGYGVYRLNLLALLNPDGGTLPDHWSWSSFLPNLPHGAGDYEGFAYAGLGILAAIILAFPLAIVEHHSYRGKTIWPLTLAALVLTLFALSPHLAVADRGILIPAPDILYALAGSMRSSGRFFWPVYYLLPIGAVWLLQRGFGDRKTGVLLLVLAALQIYDTAPGWSSLHARFERTGSSLPSSIDDPRLAVVASHYAAVRMIPAGNQRLHWDEVAGFALQVGKPTDVTYLARPDDEGYATYMSSIVATIGRHGLASDSLYFLNRYYASKVAAHMGPADAMFRAGDLYVFAPGWTNLGLTTQLPSSRPWSPM